MAGQHGHHEGEGGGAAAVPGRGPGRGEGRHLLPGVAAVEGVEEDLEGEPGAQQVHGGAEGEEPGVHHLVVREAVVPWW